MNDIKPKNNSLITDTKSIVNSSKIQNSITEAKVNNIKSKIGDTKIIYPSLKCKMRTKGQGSQSKYNNFSQYLHI